MKEVTISKSKSILGFEKDNNNWERFLTIEGNKAYYLGVDCGTCAFLFERLGGANKQISPKKIASKLKEGINHIDDIKDNIIELIPNGNYYINLFNITPKQVEIGSNYDYFNNEQIEIWGINKFWHFQHHPKISYYRGKTAEFEKNKILYEFIVPMFPQGWLEEDTINEYKRIFKQGNTPTALAISILDIKQAYDSDIEHWCLTHYLIDGHHKTYTANLLNKEISILSFISIDQGVSSKENIELLFNYLL